MKALSKKSQRSLENVLGQLRAEHSEIQALLCLYAVEPAQDVREHLLTRICRVLRLHCALETGVVIPAMAEASANTRLLEQTGTAFAHVLGMINDLAAGQHTQEELQRGVHALHVHVNEHIADAESGEGILNRAHQFAVDWPTLEKSLIKRRGELDPPAPLCAS